MFILGYGFKEKNFLDKKLSFKSFFNKKKIANLIDNTKLKVLQQKKQGTKVINLKKIILESQFNLTVNVYNGCKWLPILISSLKIGRRYKDFVLTKRMGTSIHRLQKKKNK